MARPNSSLHCGRSAILALVPAKSRIGAMARTQITTVFLAVLSARAPTVATTTMSNTGVATWKIIAFIVQEPAALSIEARASLRGNH